MHFAVPSPQTPGTHQHLYALNTFSFFFLNHSILSLSPLLGPFMGLSLELMILWKADANAWWPQSCEKRVQKVAKKTYSNYSSSPSRRLKWWSGNTLHTVWCLFSRGPSSLCFATQWLQCKSQSYPLLLLVICSLDVELKKSPWAGLFPQHSPTHRYIHTTHTHTVFYRHISFSQILTQLTHAHFWRMGWVYS